jgi:transportin-3
VTHDCLEPQAASSPKFSIYAAAINGAVNANGLTLVACILNGLVGDFPEEAIPTIVSILRMFAYIWPTQLLAWLPQALEQLPLQSGPIQAKTQFLSDISTAINTRQQDKVKQAVLEFDRASRKARDRRRNGL